MALEKYKDHKFQRKTLERYVYPANVILEDYAARGFTLTIRQLFYQFVARSLLENTANNYTNLGWAMTNARDAGLIDWDYIEDRSRILNAPATWASPADILAAAARSYKEDLWETQPRYIEVWVEKDALSGMFARVCADYRLPLYPHRRHDSTSMAREAGLRLARKIDEGQDPLILSFTDHDVGGLDMRRDIEQRLAMYARAPVEVRILGLTRDQVDQFDPPPNFAKETDKRYQAYLAEHGPYCWELDALPPDEFDRLVRDEVEAELDLAAWNAALKREARNRATLAPKKRK